MNSSKFKDFIRCLGMADSLNSNVIQIFKTLMDLKDEVKTELINLKPENEKWEYEAMINKLLHDLDKLDYLKNIDFSSIDKWLKKFDTPRDEFLKWYSDSPNVNHWYTPDSPNNILYLILKTNINFPDKEVEKYLKKIDYSEKQVIQYHFEKFIKSFVVNRLYKFLKKEDTIENPYPRVFPLSRAYKLFETYSIDINPDTELADYSFIYRRMVEDRLIFPDIKDKEFTNWLNREYEVTLERTKQLHVCKTNDREKIYKLLKVVSKTPQ